MTLNSYVARSAAVTPGGIHSQRRQTTPPLCLARARGARVWDANGKEYIDFHNAYGAVILGHGNERLIANVADGLRRLDLAGLGVTPAEVELSETLVANVPCFEQVLLCNTGSEATLHAIRLARGVTGRQRVLKFQGAYHGTHDYALSNRPLGSSAATGDSTDLEAGVFAPAADATLVCRYNDLESVGAVVAEYGNDVAAIIVEPYAHNIGGAAPQAGFLEGLRETASRIGAVLIFDEVITGIRYGLGGYQQVAGVTPDLASLAKALGNGLPIAAIGGKKDFMTHFNTTRSGDVLYSGTFNGGGGPVAAALTTIAILSEPGAYAKMACIGERMRSGLREIFGDAGIEANVSGLGSVLHILLGDKRPVRSHEDVARNDLKLYSAFRRIMLTNGVLDAPDARALRSYVTLSHGESDIDFALSAAQRSIRGAMRECGL